MGEVKEVYISNITWKEFEDLGRMFMEFYKELHGDKASSDLNKYINRIIEYLKMPNYRIFTIYGKGFCIIAEFTDKLKEPEEKIYEGIHVYVRPKYRKTRVYKMLYDKVEEVTRDGALFLPVLINSDHLPIIEKRHKLIMKVFEFVRR